MRPPKEDIHSLSLSPDYCHGWGYEPSPAHLVIDPWRECLHSIFRWISPLKICSIRTFRWQSTSLSPAGKVFRLLRNIIAPTSHPPKCRKKCQTRSFILWFLKRNFSIIIKQSETFFFSSSTKNSNFFHDFPQNQRAFLMMKDDGRRKRREFHSHFNFSSSAFPSDSFWTRSPIVDDSIPDPNCAVRRLISSFRFNLWGEISPHSACSQPNF